MVTQSVMSHCRFDEGRFNKNNLKRTLISHSSLFKTSLSTLECDKETLFCHNDFCETLFHGPGGIHNATFVNCLFNRAVLSEGFLFSNCMFVRCDFQTEHVDCVFDHCIFINCYFDEAKEKWKEKCCSNGSTLMAVVSDEEASAIKKRTSPLPSVTHDLPINFSKKKHNTWYTLNQEDAIDHRVRNCSVYTDNASLYKAIDSFLDDPDKQARSRVNYLIDCGECIQSGDKRTCFKRCQQNMMSLHKKASQKID